MFDYHTLSAGVPRVFRPRRGLLRLLLLLSSAARGADEPAAKPSHPGRYPQRYACPSPFSPHAHQARIARMRGH